MRSRNDAACSTLATPPWLRVTAFHLLGVALLAGAYGLRDHAVPLISRALSGLGLFTFYTAGYAALHLYDIWPQEFKYHVAFAEGVAITALAIWIAVPGSPRPEGEVAMAPEPSLASPQIQAPAAPLAASEPSAAPSGANPRETAPARKEAPAEPAGARQEAAPDPALQRERANTLAAADSRVADTAASPAPRADAQNRSPAASPAARSSAASAICPKLHPFTRRWK